MVFWRRDHWGVGERLTWGGGEADLVVKVGDVVKDKKRQTGPFQSGFPPFIQCRAWPVLSCLLGGLLAASGPDARGLGEGPRELPRGIEAACLL